MLLQLFKAVETWTRLRIGGFQFRAGLADLRLQYGHLRLEILGHGLHILQTQARILHAGHQAAYLVDGPGRHVLVLAAPGNEHLAERLGEGHRIVVEQFLGEILVGACELVGILALWQQHALHREACQQQRLAVLDGGRLSGLVGVVDHAHLRGESLQQPHLVWGEGRSGTSDGILHAVLGQRHHVELSLHQIGIALLADGLAGLPETEQVTPLGEQVRLAGIEVLGRTAVNDLLERTSAEGDHVPPPVVEREHHPVAERVVLPAILRGANDIHLLQTVLGVPEA